MSHQLPIQNTPSFPSLPTFVAFLLCGTLGTALDLLSSERKRWEKGESSHMKLEGRIEDKNESEGEEDPISE